MGYFDLKRFPLKGHVWERWVFFVGILWLKIKSNLIGIQNVIYQPINPGLIMLEIQADGVTIIGLSLC